MFGPVAPCPHESLLDGKTEGRRGGFDRYAQGTSRPHLRCRPLDGQTLRRQGRTWRRPDPAQATRQAPQGGRDCAGAPRARPGRTPDGPAAGERPAAGARGRGGGERLHRLANPEAHGISTCSGNVTGAAGCGRSTTGLMEARKRIPLRRPLSRLPTSPSSVGSEVGPLRCALQLATIGIYLYSAGGRFLEEVQGS
jgi:hypothetical protein